MPVDPAVIPQATLSLTQGVSLFQGFLPKFEEIRKKDPESNPEFVTDVRMGELAASLLTLGIGGMMTSLTGSMVPVVVSLVCVIGLVCMYEAALSANRGKVE